MEEPFGLQDHSDGSPIYSKDPVCRRDVDEAKAAGKLTHLGATYYFCSRTCKQAFEASPGTYTGVPRVARP
ncbi:MAG TPA: YHS domain-containing protein [Bryobacteraceae bacterium]|jgi:YHS domain-containing protein